MITEHGLYSDERNEKHNGNSFLTIDNLTCTDDASSVVDVVTVTDVSLYLWDVFVHCIIVSRHHQKHVFGAGEELINKAPKPSATENIP
jgi:hypothetical protein